MISAAVWVGGASALIALCGLTLSVFKGRKTIVWKVLADSPMLLELPEAQRIKTKLQVETTVVARPRYIDIEIRNAGRVTLSREDVSIWPTLAVKDAKIVAESAALRIKGSTGESPLTCTRKNESEVTVGEALLNPGDAIRLRVVVDGGTEPPVVEMHAAGFLVRRSRRKP